MLLSRRVQTSLPPISIKIINHSLSKTPITALDNISTKLIKATQYHMDYNEVPFKTAGCPNPKPADWMVGKFVHESIIRKHDPHLHTIPFSTIETRAITEASSNGLNSRFSNPHTRKLSSHSIHELPA